VPAKQISPTPTARYSWYVVVIMTLVYMTNVGDRYILATVVEPIKAELHVSDTYIGLLSGFSFAMLYGGFAVVVALFADRSNRRNIIAGAVFIYSVMTGACGLAQSYTQLIFARMGVALGESGTSPPSHSLISDLFPPTKRTLPLSVLSLGASIGTWYGYAGGSFFAELYGWRSPFIAMTIPGIILAIMIRLTVREPERGRFDGVASETARNVPTLAKTLAFMWSQKALLHVIIGASLINFFGYAMALWNAAFMERSLGMSIGAAGHSLGIWYALVGGNAGILIGGYLTQILGERDVRWHSRASGIMFLAAFVPIIYVYLLPLGWAFNLCNIALGFAMHGYLGGVFSMIQNLVAIRMRALAAAICFFFMNIIGLGFGPLTVGALSDYLTTHTHLGVDALRYALLSTTVVIPWAAFHFFRAERSLKADYRRALDFDASLADREAHLHVGPAASNIP
jgi:MFS family permease